MKKTILILMAMLLLIAFPAVATVTYTLTAPANLYETTSTSVTWQWNATSDDTTQPAGMTTWLYLSAVNNDTAVVNASVRIYNDTWYNTTTQTLSEGFFTWYLVTNDSDGNTTSESRWLEVRGSDNESDFRWENETGFLAMLLDSNTGDLSIYGNLSVAGDVNCTSFNISGNLEMGGDNITGATFVSSGNLSGNLSWSDLYGYPSACSATTGPLTGLGDSTTCTDAWVRNTGDTISGDLNWTTGGIRNISRLIAIANLDIGAYTLTGTRFISDIAQGTAPFGASSSTVVANLNASYANESYDVKCTDCLGPLEINDSYVLNIGDTITGDTKITADLNVTGNITGNNFYGGMWNYTANATAWTYTISTANIYYNLTSLSSGALNGFNFTSKTGVNGGSYLTALKAGTYQIHADISAEALASTALYSMAVVKNFNVSNSENCYARRDIGTDVGSFSVSCFLTDIAIGDKINLQIENEENTNDIKFHTVNMILARVGD